MEYHTLLSESFERAAYSLSTSLDKFGRDGNLDESMRSFERSVNKMVAALGMQAENDQRKQLGHSMAYTENDFASL